MSLHYLVKLEMLIIWYWCSRLYKMWRRELLSVSELVRNWLKTNSNNYNAHISIPP